MSKETTDELNFTNPGPELFPVNIKFPPEPEKLAGLLQVLMGGETDVLIFQLSDEVIEMARKFALVEKIPPKEESQ